MDRLGFYLLLPWIYLISLLPFWLLYRFADGIFFLLYYFPGYRKKIVMRNLRNSFPEKTEEEIHRIAKKFYQYFADLVLESLKLLTISPTELKKHISMPDTSPFNTYFKANQSVVVIMGHFGNWEWAGACFALKKLHPLYVIYHPLANPHFDNLVKHMRTRFGNRIYAMKEATRGILKNQDQVSATTFIADQSPSPKNAYWTRFLNQDTPIFLGPEKIAKKLNFPVIYVSVKRIGRGQYRIDNELLFAHPKNTQDFEISAKHTKKLEQDIRDYPETWLWTHRRWKYKK